MTAAIEVGDLRKVYDGVSAVDGVSLTIEIGEVYALLGHNGAGKSTTVEILEGHRPRTSGHASVLGMDPGSGGRALRDRIGVVLQTSGVEPNLTVSEAIGVYGSCYSRRRPMDEVLTMAGLTEHAERRIGTLSGGQQRRVDLALGIVGYPEVLFLDEPTTGFDPAARRSAWEVVRELGSGGTTVLLTTHYLDEAEYLADRVGVIARGQFVAEGTPAELVGGDAATTVRFELPAGAPIGGIDGALPPGASVDGRRVSFVTRHPTRDVHAVCARALEIDIELTGLTVHRPSLEDAFLQLAGESAVPE